MAEEDSVEQLTVVVDRAFVFLSRPEVVEQLIVLGAVLVASRVVSRIFWWIVDWWLSGLRPTGIIARRLSSGLTGVVFRVVRSASAPILGIVLAVLAQRELEEMGRVTGLLSELVSVFVVLLAAEVVMTVLVGGLDPAEERRYRRRFFKPLIVIVVGLMVLDQLADLGRLSRAPVFELFGSPISLGALFIATLGIWFWTDAINLLNTVIVDFVAKHTTLNDGSADAGQVRPDPDGCDLRGRSAPARPIDDRSHHRRIVGGHRLRPAGGAGELHQRHLPAVRAVPAARGHHRDRRGDGHGRTALGPINHRSHHRQRGDRAAQPEVLHRVVQDVHR
jgi:hypothetical protein